MEIKRTKMPPIGTIDTQRNNIKLYISISSYKNDFNTIEFISTSIHQPNVQKKTQMLYLFQNTAKNIQPHNSRKKTPVARKKHHLHLQLLALVLTPTQCC